MSSFLFFFFYCTGFLFNHHHETAKHFSTTACLKTTAETWNEPHEEALKQARMPNFGSLIKERRKYGCTWM